MRVLVCGGRVFTDSKLVYATLDEAHRARGIDVVIEGDARGAGRMAGYWARHNRIDNLKFRAEWDRYGLAAGRIRNQKMLDEGRPDCVIAFHDGAGTADMVERAECAGIEVIHIKGRSDK